ncbi:MAG: ribosome maturation factor RimM [Gammaproteobacteria bacterium]|nr:ribosome maturation factor RimM [Gammaproteobacteria bacterium]
MVAQHILDNDGTDAVAGINAGAAGDNGDTVAAADNGDATAGNTVADASDATAPVIVGKISAPAGVKGWLKVHSFTRPAAQILRYRRWLLAGRRDGDWRAFHVTAAREQPPKLFAKLAGVDDRNTVEALTGRWIAVAPAQLEALPPGEYYWSDLIGLTVVNRDGVELGVVDHLLETGANDVLVVRQERRAGAQELLLPWSPHAIVEVDVAAGRLRVDWDSDWDAATVDAATVDATVDGARAAG